MIQTVTVLLAVKLFNYCTWKHVERLGTLGYLISILNSLSVLSHPIIWEAQRGLLRQALATFAIKETIMTKTVIMLSVTVCARGICLLITLFWLDTLIKRTKCLCSNLIMHQSRGEHTIELASKSFWSLQALAQHSACICRAALQCLLLLSW